MSSRTKQNLIRAFAALFFCAAAFVMILYAREAFDFSFIERPEKALTPPPSDTVAVPDAPVSQGETPIDEIVVPNDPSSTLSYEEQLALVPGYEEAAAAGMTLTGAPYDTATSRLVLTASSTLFPDALSLRNAPARTLSSSVNAKGSTLTIETTADAPRAVLRVYMGYILYDDGAAVKLLDSKGGVLMNDISAYEPVYRCDLAGHPLFKKDDRYYYYYNGASTTPGTIVLDALTVQSAAEYEGVPEPSAFAYITGSAETTPTLPASAGMVECTVNEHYFNDIAVNSRYNSMRNASGLYRFCEQRVTKVITNQAEIDRVNALIARQQAQLAGNAKGNANGSVTPIAPVEPEYEITDEAFFWGYMDADGNLSIEPRYEAAYDFSANGLAVVEDENDRTVVINTYGTIMFNAFRTVLYLSESGGTPVRDGHYLPDTYGDENVGMFAYDHSLLRVRRKLLDTANGYIFRSDTASLVNKKGELFNIPYGYRLVAYSDGMLLLEKNGLYGFMNYTGRWIVQPSYTYAEPFSEGLAVVGHPGALAMIDTNGTVVLPMIYDHISPSADGVVVAYKQGHGWTLYNKLSTQKQEEPAVNPILALLRRRLVADLAAEAAQASTAG